MKMHCVINSLKLFVVLFVFVFFIGCGADSKDDEEVNSPSSDDNTEISVSLVQLTASQQSVAPGGTITVSAVVKSSSGSGLSGKTVFLSMDNPSLGSVKSSLITDENGAANAVFTAGASSGSVGLTASCDDVLSEKFVISITDQSIPKNITATMNPSEILATKTSSISARVTDENGGLVENGTSVTFSISNTDYGSFGGNSSVSSSTNEGIALATFTAENKPGKAKINIKSGSASVDVDLIINPADAASIEFLEVSNNPVAIRNTGGVESSVIKFNVQDMNGEKAQGVEVTFSMEGPGGGEYLDEEDNTPNTQTVSASNGIAQVVFHSGLEPGTVTISASTTTVAGKTIIARAPVISIGGGVPTNDRFSVSVEQANLAGFAYDNIKTNMNVLLADRYGNFNVLDGHSVSFATEVGLAINSTSVSQLKQGQASVELRTQGSPIGVPCRDVVPEDWEVGLKTRLFNEYGVNFSGNPRDGVCSVLIFTKGEESFEDGSNGSSLDGAYNQGETFRDTFTDPFRDYDDDGDWDDGTEATLDTTLTGGVNPYDEYVDAGKNNVWDGLNGEWESDKYLFRNYQMLITGAPNIRAYVEDQNGDGISESSFVVETSNDLNGDGDTTDKPVIHFLICDSNYNPITPGSSFAVSVGAGEVTGQISQDYPDFSSPGQNIEYQVMVVDDDPADLDPPKDTTLQIKVTWKTGDENIGDLVQTLSISGIVD